MSEPSGIRDVLLIPGLTGGPKSFGRPFLSELKKFGLKPLVFSPPWDYTMEKAVSGAASVLKQGGPWALFGFSMGVTVAFMTALAHRETPKALALCSGSLGAFGGGNLDKVLKDPWPDWYRTLIKLSLPDRVIKRFGDDLEALVPEVSEQERAFFEKERKELKKSRDLSDQVKSLDIPTLVCCGEMDELISPHESLKIAALTRGSFVSFKARHSVMYDCPKDLAKALWEFLRALGPRV